MNSISVITGCQYSETNKRLATLTLEDSLPLRYHTSLLSVAPKGTTLSPDVFIAARYTSPSRCAEDGVLRDTIKTALSENDSDLLQKAISDVIEAGNNSVVASLASDTRKLTASEIALNSKSTQ